MDIVDATAETLFFALARAEDAVSRLDEIVRACPFADGWVSRVDFAEAIAWGWNSGFVVTLDDLLLHDGKLDAHAPEPAMLTARGLLTARRRARRAGPELLSAAGIAWLAGASRRPPLPGPARPRKARQSQTDTFSRASTLDGLAATLKAAAARGSDATQENLNEWLALFCGRDLEAPPLLQAAFGLEAWSIIDPLPRRAFLGPVLVAHWLHTEKRFRGGLLGIEGGVRARTRLRGVVGHDPLDRMKFWLGAMADGAAAGVAEVQRLTLARLMLERRARGRRASSKIPEAINYVMGRPLVTANDLAGALKVTGTSARRLLEELSPPLKEVSGRSHYRAWRL